MDEGELSIQEVGNKFCRRGSFPLPYKGRAREGSVITKFTASVARIKQSGDSSLALRMTSLLLCLSRIPKSEVRRK